MGRTEDLPRLRHSEAETPWPLALLERDIVPDAIIRFAIRRMLRQRLREEDKGDPELQQAHFMRFIDRLKSGPIAIETAAANAQHYEVPARFFELALGKRLKYSCALWPEGTKTLDEAEETMLAVTVGRARLEKRPTNSRTRLRMGIALALCRGEVSQQPDRQRFKFPFAEDFHRHSG